MSTSPSSGSPSPPRVGGEVEERRPLTVVFCDLVDSTALSERLDAERFRDILREYQQAVVAVVERFEGYVAQYQGDGILLYFGYPEAHEDDPRRAVAAAVEAVETVRKLGERLEREEGIGLSIRLGIHTGTVLLANVGGGGRIEQMALGDTPNLAARLQSLAERDTVVVSGATRRLVEGLFEWESLGPRNLKGITTPVEVYRVVGPAPSKSRFEAAAARGLTPFVGREHELGILLDHWEQARSGSGQVVLIGAEPGLGKSRLVHELRERIPDEERTAIEFECSPLYRNTMLHPVVSRLPSLLGFSAEDTPLRKLEILNKRVAEAAPLFAPLLSMPMDPPLNMSPQLQRERTREALVAWLFGQAEGRPLIFCFEDLQWADPATLELVELLVERCPTASVLAVLTFRPEFRPPWEPRHCGAQLTLGRLDPANAEALVTRVAGGKALPAEVTAEIIRKTDGVPLFLEELTRMLLESGHLSPRDGGYDLMKPIAELDIPSTLQGSLMARLDRLGEAKEVAQLGAVIGREFDYALMRAVSPVDETAFTRALSNLVDAGLLYQRDVSANARYTFKHALVQDAAYQSLLKRTRRELHRKIADMLTYRFFEVAQSQPELIAHHYTEAGEIPLALSFWQDAGNRAIGRNAIDDALAHARRGIDLLPRLPDPSERAFIEIGLTGIVFTGSLLRFGASSVEVESLLPRITKLTEELPPSPALALSLFLRGHVQVFGKTQQDFQAGRDTLERSLKLAEETTGLTLIAPTIHTVLGEALISMGEFELALEHLRSALSSYDPEIHDPRRNGNPFDLRAQALALSGLALLSLGYIDRARAACDEAIAHAKAIDHPPSLAYVLSNWLVGFISRREPQTVAAYLKTLIEIAREQKLPMYEAMGSILLGEIAIEDGRIEEGIRLVEESRARTLAMQANGVALTLAQAYARLDRLEEASRLLAEAREWEESTGAHLYESMIEGTAGRLAFLRGDLAGAEAHLRAGLEISRRQKAKLSELLFAIELARLLRTQGKKADARRPLSEVYDWFTEGLDTPILKEARALLDELS